MTTNTEERLARLEVLVNELRDDIKEIKVANASATAELRAQVAELTKAAHLGKGALWIMLPTGTLIGWIITHLVEWLHK